MNTRKTLALALLLAAPLVYGSASADRTRSNDDGWMQGPPGAAQQLARLDRALDLSDDQAARLLDILQVAEAERAALHARVIEQMQPEICALRNSTESEILAVLTDEQAQEFLALHERRHERFEDRHGFAPPDCDDDAN